MSSPRWRSAHRYEQSIKTLLLRTLEAEASAVSLPGRAVHVRGDAADGAQRADPVEKAGECGGDDLTRSWLKLVDKQQKQVQITGKVRQIRRSFRRRLTSTACRSFDAQPISSPRPSRVGSPRTASPAPAVTLLVGDEGIGKSLLWVWVVAAVTIGKALPEFGIPARQPSPVATVVTEDGWQDTIGQELVNGPSRAAAVHEPRHRYLTLQRPYGRAAVGTVVVGGC
jgi:hypothetical protein